MAKFFEVSNVGPVQLIRLHLPESLDSVEFDSLNESLLALVTQRSAGGSVMDLSDLAYAGSSVLGLLVNMRQRVKQAGGRLVLCGLSSSLLRIFQTCSLERLFIIKKSASEAVAAC